jgi:hypothetical protein
MNYKELWVQAITFFASTNKTGWGKNEIVAKLKEMEIDHARSLEERNE